MDNKENEELQSRHAFFKNAVKAALPVIEVDSRVAQLKKKVN